jgi:hypothetical protein
MESILDGQRSSREVSDLLQINLELIQRTANRMLEQRFGSAFASGIAAGQRPKTAAGSCWVEIHHHGRRITR